MDVPARKLKETVAKRCAGSDEKYQDRQGNHLFVLATAVLLCAVYFCVWNPKSDDPLKFGFEVLGF